MDFATFDYFTPSMIILGIITYYCNVMKPFCCVTYMNSLFSSAPKGTRFFFPVFQISSSHLVLPVQTRSADRKTCPQTRDKLVQQQIQIRQEGIQSWKIYTRRRKMFVQIPLDRLMVSKWYAGYEIPSFFQFDSLNFFLDYDWLIHTSCLNEVFFWSKDAWHQSLCLVRSLGLLTLKFLRTRKESTCDLDLLWKWIPPYQPLTRNKYQQWLL